MRPNTWSSLRWIAAVLLLSGCYRPLMSPQQGYGYGGAYPGGMYQGGYGGNQGIQTLTPGQYYAPGAAGSTYIQGTPNGLQPVVDPNNSGTGTGTGNGSGDGGDAPRSPYNPPESGVPTKPVPEPYYPSDGDTGGGQLQPPASEGEIQERKIDLDGASTSEPAAAGEWAAEPVLETAELPVETAEQPIESVNNEAIEAAMEVPLLQPTP